MLAEDSLAVVTLMTQCEKAAGSVNVRSLLRIDYRQDQQGQYFLFDENLKPNITGAGRPSRDDQDSLSTMAARSIGWRYQDLLFTILAQRWSL
ncbi:hypothetical protein SAMN05216167_12030 [Spirosoma endophyticum]|uniref:Uncharacterized protein n=2 Tax=Spirosoma endophyticum TaxID=662367 RepID=A0A1I2DRH0_9BACT|nr:hypothetical protein SAMN05216167_12030 [Spirosoma endophyticum]